MKETQTVKLTSTKINLPLGIPVVPTDPLTLHCPGLDIEARSRNPAPPGVYTDAQRFGLPLS